MSSATRRGTPMGAWRGAIAALFLERGHAYVYLAYGLSWMLDVARAKKGVGAGVLIRALSRSKR